MVSKIINIYQYVYKTLNKKIENYKYYWNKTFSVIVFVKILI